MRSYCNLWNLRLQEEVLLSDVRVYFLVVDSLTSTSLGPVCTLPTSRYILQRNIFGRFYGIIHGRISIPSYDSHPVRDVSCVNNNSFDGVLLQPGRISFCVYINCVVRLDDIGVVVVG